MNNYMVRGKFKKGYQTIDLKECIESKSPQTAKAIFESKYYGAKAYSVMIVPNSNRR